MGRAPVTEAVEREPATSRQRLNSCSAPHALLVPGRETWSVTRVAIRLLAAVRHSIREHGGEPSSRLVDELLDERAELTGS